ncbi:hypothetical protein [Streptomyces zhaozhouensis]|uniref:hypothetical protein n=1 Tax=Streptomyces zhaozhouensis TaxID=1300267 RepID=UPI000BE3B9D6|nr:hypothetical protein [Streptomyces zhaozhouensis]
MGVTVQDRQAAATAAERSRAAAAAWDAQVGIAPAGSTPDPAAAARLCRSNAAAYQEIAAGQV